VLVNSMRKKKSTLPPGNLKLSEPLRVPLPPPPPLVQPPPLA